MHAYVTAGTVERIGDLPNVWQYPEDFDDPELAGRSVSGFRFLDPAELVAAGWLPVEDVMPVYDEATHYLVAVEPPLVEEGRVVRTWEAQERPVDPVPEPSAAEEAAVALVGAIEVVRGKPGTTVAELDAKLNELADILAGAGTRPAQVAGRPT